MPISPDRAQFIADIANDEWVDRVEGTDKADFDRLSEEWDDRCDTFLETCTSSEELHLFADLWNWDAGTSEELESVINSPHCEAATALLVFWRAQPEDLEEFQGDSLIEEPYGQLMRAIQVRYVRGDYQVGVCSYDPRSDGAPKSRPSAPRSGTWSIAAAMYVEVTPGE